MTFLRARSLAPLCALSLVLAASGCDPYRGMSQAEIGRKVYETQCARCHQVDGGGVPDLQPALAGSAIVLGDPAVLIEVIVEGSAAPTLQSRESYGNAMAGHSHLSDQELAAVASYLRNAWGNQAPEISRQEAESLR